MTNPVLPASLKPVVDGYSSDDPGGVMRTEVAGGASRFALNWDRGQQRFNITFIFTELEFSVWSLFYLHIIKKGAIAFNMPLNSGFGMQVHTVNIMPGTYSASRTSGVMMTVNFVAETENKGYEFSAADAQGAIDLYSAVGADYTSLLDRLGRFATVESNVLGAP